MMGGFVTVLRIRPSFFSFSSFLRAGCRGRRPLRKKRPPFAKGRFPRRGKCPRSGQKGGGSWREAPGGFPARREACPHASASRRNPPSAALRETAADTSLLRKGGKAGSAMGWATAPFCGREPFYRRGRACPSRREKANIEKSTATSQFLRNRRGFLSEIFFLREGQAPPLRPLTGIRGNRRAADCRPYAV